MNQEIDRLKQKMQQKRSDFDNCSRNCYQIADEIKDINLELTRLQQQEQSSSSRKFGR